jgi:uncharacterized glyoxalase superfamily protein PhnB
MGVHLAVRDMAAAMDFYRRIGLAVPDEPDGEHVQLVLDGGAHLELSTRSVVDLYDPGWRGHQPSTATVLQFRLPSRDAVDELYAALTGAGYHGHLAPIDAFWGSRYCEVDDADGHAVGFHSPRSEG